MDPDSFKPCPFCGSEKLRVVIWMSTGKKQIDGVECLNCMGMAPAGNWNQRTTLTWPTQDPFDTGKEKSE